METTPHSPAPQSGFRRIFHRLRTGFQALFTQSRQSLWQQSAKRIGAFAGALLLGSFALPYGVYPFGFAFAAAMTDQTLFAVLGLICSAFFTVNLQAATVIAALLLPTLRYCFRFFGDDKPHALFCEPVWARVTVTVISALLCSFYRLLNGGFRAYDWAGAFLLIGISIAAVTAFCGAFGLLRFRSARPIGRLALATVLVLCLRDTLFLGISPAACLVFFLALYAGYTDVGSGCITGMVCGIALSLPAAPAYAIAGLLFALLRPLNLPLALAWACAGAGTYVAFSDSLLSVYSMLPDWIIAVGVFLLWQRFVPVSEAKTKTYEQMLLPLREAAAQSKFEALSCALTALSETFYQLSERLQKPSIYAVRQMCDETLRQSCKSCPECGKCKAGTPVGHLRTVDELAGRMYLSGQVEEEEAPELLAEHCVQLHNVMEKVNRTYGKLLQKAMEGNRAEIFASDYAAMSKLLRHAVESAEEEYEVNAEKTHQACLQAQKIGFHAKDMAVCGKRQLQLCAIGVDQAQLTPKDLQQTMERVVGVPLTSPVFEMQNENGLTMRMWRRPVLCATSACFLSAKKGEEVCGDVITSFEGENGMFYTLISDGMGSGQEAAISAGICRVFLEKMLLAGNSRSVSMEMLNDLIRNKNTENFATVDLLEVDLLCREARFLKSGAAPSFVLRGGNLFKIAANTLPVGIAKSLNAEEIRFALEDGDVILMFSDGVAQSFEDSLWLLGVVSCEWEDDLDAMAKKILKYAKEQNDQNDDMSVGLIQIRETFADSCAKVS